MAAFDFLQTTKRNLEQQLMPGQSAVKNPEVTGLLNPIAGGAGAQMPPELPQMQQGLPQQPQIPLPGGAGGDLGVDEGQEGTLQEVLRLGTIELLKSYLKMLKGGTQPQGGGQTGTV